MEPEDYKIPRHDGIVQKKRIYNIHTNTTMPATHTAHANTTTPTTFTTWNADVKVIVDARVSANAEALTKPHLNTNVDAYEHNRQNINVHSSQHQSTNEDFKPFIYTYTPRKNLRCLSGTYYERRNNREGSQNYTDFSIENILSSQVSSIDEYDLSNSGTVATSDNVDCHSQLNHSVSMNIGKMHDSTTAHNFKRSTSRQRTFFEPRKQAVLEESYQITPYADKATRVRLAKALNITEQQVKIWFQNRRSKDKNNAKTKKKCKS